jgi:Uma2 family endonuclease
MVTQLRKRLFTTEQYHQMASIGILGEYDHVELIEGEIVEMSPIGPLHAAHVKRMIKLLTQQVEKDAIVAAQDPVYLSDRSEPQPDLALLKPRSDFYASGHPRPEDVFLLIEVADTTIETDRDLKVPLYASYGIPEVWLIDIQAQTVEVYRDPTPKGYKRSRICQKGQTIAVQALPNISFTVEEILGLRS